MMAAASLALVVALAMVAVPRVMYAVCLGPRWQIPAFRDWALRTMFLTFCVELVVAGAIGTASATWVGAAAVTFAGAYFGSVAGKARRLQAACKGLLDPATRDASLAYVQGEVDRRKRKGEKAPSQYPGYARTAMVLANAIDAAGLPATAIGTLEAVDADRLDPRLRAMRAQNLAAFHLRSGDRAAAREILARVPRPVPDPVYEDALAALDTLLVSLDGDAEQAEARARAGLRASAVATVRASWEAALSHALAARGSREEALTVLREMRASYGDAALDRVARHRGPASALAESLRAETGAPYR